MQTITLKKMTVIINEEFQDKILSLNGKELNDIDILKELRDINKWLISQLSWLSIEEVNNLDLETYNKLQDQAWVITNINNVFNEMNVWIKKEEIEEKKKS